MDIQCWTLTVYWKIFQKWHGLNYWWNTCWFFFSLHLLLVPCVLGSFILIHVNILLRTCLFPSLCLQSVCYIQFFIFAKSTKWGALWNATCWLFSLLVSVPAWMSKLFKSNTLNTQNIQSIAIEFFKTNTVWERYVTISRIVQYLRHEHLSTLNVTWHVSSIVVRSLTWDPLFWGWSFLPHTKDT